MGGRRRRAPGSELDLLRGEDLAAIARAVGARLAAQNPAAAGRALPACPSDLEVEARAWQTGSAPLAFAKKHSAPLRTLGWIAGTDLTAMAAHAAGGPDAYLAILGLSAAAGLRAAWKQRLKAWKYRLKMQESQSLTLRQRKRLARARRYASGAWAAGTGAALTGTWTGVLNGPAQAIVLLGGLAYAAPYLWHNRHRPSRSGGPQAAPPAITGPDPRLGAFGQRFCLDGPLRGAILHSLAGIPGGFAFEVVLDQNGRATTKDVIALRPQIAALYDVPADQVTVEYGPKRSERRARVAVLTAERALEREDPWDGRSTYDPETGCFDLGRFTDSARMRWMLHKPYSGAAGGVIAGVIGSGKTGTAHVVACETGLAKLCARCGGARACGQCDMRRIAGLWIGDPQRQPFAVWRGRADLTAWGPEACVRMLQWLHAAMRSRAGWLGQLRWVDHLGRENTGKGWFDPSPQFPLLYAVIDEWPLVSAHPELGKLAIQLAADIGKESRKVGIGLVLLSQIPDLSQLGERAVREMLKAFNVIAHRTDGLSKYMLGIQGDPTQLPAGVDGVGYINGIDQRPGATFRTKRMREFLRPGETGLDVREIAERIAAEPIALDEGILRAIRPLGYTGPGQVLTDGVLAAAAAAATMAPPGPATTAAVPSAAPARPGTVPAGLVAAVLAARGQLDLYDVMEAAEVDALAADRALMALVSAGKAVQLSPTRYAAMPGHDG